MKHITLVLLLAALPGAVAGAPLLTRNGLSAEGTRAEFEVFSRAGSGGSAYFCAAGDFARRALGAGATDRVELVGRLGPSTTREGRLSVVFRVRPPRTGRNEGIERVFLFPGSVGTSRTVAHAVHLCDVAARREGRSDD